MITRIIKSKNYAVITNDLLQDRRLTWKAKGLMAYVMSLPDTWQFSIDGLAAFAPDGKGTVTNILKELKQYGYLTVIKMYPNESKTGRFEYIYEFRETPLNKGNEEGDEDKTSDIKQGIEKQALNFNALKSAPLINTKEKELKEQRTKDIKDIVMYLNEALEARYKPESKQLQEMINGRLSEGYTVEDFKKVIDNMKAEWGEDEKMSKYLRPSTLFAPTHFPEYLNRKPKKQKPKVSYLYDDDEDDLGAF